MEGEARQLPARRLAVESQASAGARDGVKGKPNELAERTPLHALVGLPFQSRVARLNQRYVEDRYVIGTAGRVRRPDPNRKPRLMRFGSRWSRYSNSLYIESPRHPRPLTSPIHRQLRQLVKSRQARIGRKAKRVAFMPRPGHR